MTFSFNRVTKWQLKEWYDLGVLKTFLSYGKNRTSQIYGGHK